MTLPRIRQLVFASHDTDDIERLRHILDLGEGFVDPGVKMFGLTNGVFALGDQFLEVVVPIEENTAAGRFIDRSKGRGGYMAIFQTDDLAGVRARVDAAEIRRVWDIDVDDISATHLHPADIGAAIVSIDEARPPESWRWGGPDWKTNAKPGAIQQLTVWTTQPIALAQRWADILGVSAVNTSHDFWRIELAGAAIIVLPSFGEFLHSYTLKHPDPGGCIARAAALGLPVMDDPDEGSLYFRFAGVLVYLVPN